MNEQRTIQDTARLALSCLDLTSLNENDMESDIDRICTRAHGPFGNVAAVCVWPRFAAYARNRLPATVAVAAVANFPDGGSDPERAVRDTHAIVQSGAQEVDVVLPFAALQSGDEASVMHLLREVRAACPTLVLKVILETGVLASESLIRRASEISIAAGADFLKTSTGKTAISATPAAAQTMLSRIGAANGQGLHIGFKASGGIRTVADAATYIALWEERMSGAQLNAGCFRLGASSLLDDIESVLGGRQVQRSLDETY